MKLLAKIIILLLCACLLCVPVAASSVRTAQADAIVEKDGSCQVNLRFTIELDQPQKLKYPLPSVAQNVKLNGSYKTPSDQGGRLLLDLGSFDAGVHTVSISFTLQNAITEKNGSLTLHLPLLSGFGLPMAALSFEVRLPARLEREPTFTSNWGDNALSGLEVTVSDNCVYGKTTEPLLDSMELEMQYQGDHEMFPRFTAKEPLLGGWETVMAVLMAAGFGYYLLALLPSFPRKIRSFSPPEGLAAGDIGSCLTGCGMDLTMMVFSWAQLGYLSISMDKRNRVRLEKRMEMGSERSEFENRAFQKLFSGRQWVEGTGLHYALLCRKLAKKSPLLHQIYRSRSGNPQIVRWLAVAAGVCSGVILSGSVYTAGAATVLLALFMGALCGLLSYFIQSGGQCVPLGNKLPIWIGGLCGGIWIVVGWLCGNAVLAAAMVIYETLTGVAAAIGGRRSEAGRQYLAQIRGLRAHLTRGSVFDIQQCLQRNPGYFFELMPYALALGVEKRFARRFGKIRLPECDYLTAPGCENMTPARWAGLLRQVADCLNRRQRRLKYERMLQNIGKK